MSRRALMVAASLAGTLTACGLVTGLSTDYTFTDAPLDGAASGGDAASDGGGGGADGSRDGATGQQGEIGCSDGTRETFKDRVAFPRIAGCAGGWDVQGLVFNSETNQPKCGRHAGNDGLYPDGTGNNMRCTVEDLCADGWHVCGGGGDVSNSGATACDPGPNQTFWATRTVTNATNNACSPSASSGSHNNIVGCGTLGQSIGAQSCGPLNRYMTGNDCSSSSPWECGDSSPTNIEESAVVVKNGPERGGVLCCKNGN